jgi:hypothetical protein
MGLLNEIIHSIGEPAGNENFDEYLDRYLWGGRLASIYGEVVNEVRILSEQDNNLGGDVLEKSAKEIFDIIISRLDKLEPKLISALFSLHLKKTKPNNTESLRVYFSRLAFQNNNGKNKNAKRVINFLQEVAPRVHKMILLDRERLVQQNKKSNLLNGEKKRENRSIEIPYYSYG